jgi:multidrug efflux system outer membrane protein
MKKYSFYHCFNSLFKISIWVLVLIIIFQSCKLGPNYSRTLEIRQDSYRQDFPEGTSIANTPWWKLFKDTTLTSLIRTSLENNQDLKTAIKRIDESRASMNIVRANLYPRINYAVDASSTASTEAAGLTNDASGAVNISYQVDLWGRIRRLNAAALLEYLATEEAYRALTIVIVAEVANAYLNLRDLDNRLNISEQTADTWQTNMEIVQARYNGGFVSEVDLNQAKIQLAEAKTAIQTFTRLRTQTENAISILLGMPPQTIPRGEYLVDQVFPPDPPAGLPSELLDRRPDVLAAERRLQAQTERIGAAEALKYPSLTLSADMGMQFVNPTLGFAALGAQVLGPIFNYGQNKRQVEIEKARTEQLLNDYEFTFINAMREVEDAMVAVQTYENEFLLRRDQVLAAQDAARLSWVRYDGGLTSYLEVLDLQRSLFNSQLKASETLQLQLTSTVRLYQALGGGWIPGQDTIQIDQQRN